jgi:hypothetical protein
MLEVFNFKSAEWFFHEETTIQNFVAYLESYSFPRAPVLTRTGLAIAKLDVEFELPCRFLVFRSLDNPLGVGAA